MNYTTIIGLLAGALTTFSFLPQFLRAWKTRSTKDISLVMYIIFSAGILMWLLYGILLGELPIIIANIVAFLFNLMIIYLKLKYK